MLDTNLYKEYIVLTDKKSDLKSQLEKLEKEIKTKMPLLVEELLDNDMTRISIDEKTVYINNTTWANITDKEKAIEVLTNEGYGDYIKPAYSPAQVSRLLRDFEEEEKDLPASFTGIIVPYIKTNLNVVKAKR